MIEDEKPECFRWINVLAQHDLARDFTENFEQTRGSLISTLHHFNYSCAVDLLILHHDNQASECWALRGCLTGRKQFMRKQWCSGSPIEYLFLHISFRKIDDFVHWTLFGIKLNNFWLPSKSTEQLSTSLNMTEQDWIRWQNDATICTWYLSSVQLFCCRKIVFSPQLFSANFQSVCKGFTGHPNFDVSFVSGSHWKYSKFNNNTKTCAHEKPETR